MTNGVRAVARRQWDPPATPRRRRVTPAGSRRRVVRARHGRRIRRGDAVVRPLQA